MQAPREKDLFSSEFIRRDSVLITNHGGQKTIRCQVQTAKRRECQPITVYPTKPSFKNREIKIFLDKQKNNSSAVDLPCKKSKENPFGQNERTLDSKSIYMKK